MKSIKSFIGDLFVWGALIALMSCSNETGHIGMYSDSEFHNKVVQLQSKYNSSLKIDENCLRKDEETLDNINDIMRTIENSSFDYELIVSEDGGLIAMPILNTTATRSYSTELNPVSSAILSHGVLPCSIVVSGEGTNFRIKSKNGDFIIENISCQGSVTEESISFSGDIRISLGTLVFGTYYLYCEIDSNENIFDVIKKQ